MQLNSFGTSKNRICAYYKKDAKRDRDREKIYSERETMFIRHRDQQNEKEFVNDESSDSLPMIT
jgi:hypothetical protein